MVGACGWSISLPKAFPCAGWVEVAEVGPPGSKISLSLAWEVVESLILEPLIVVANAEGPGEVTRAWGGVL